MLYEALLMQGLLSIIGRTLDPSGLRKRLRCLVFLSGRKG